MKKWLSIIPAAALAGGYLGFRYACNRAAEPDWDSESALKETVLRNSRLPSPRQTAGSGRRARRMCP